VADRPGIGAIGRERRWECKAPASPPEQKIGHRGLCFGTRPCLFSEPELAMAVNGGAPAAGEHGFCVQRPAGQPLSPRAGR
jgi:hypothetical protein